MARRRTSRIVVEKASKSRSFGFDTDQFTIETNHTLLKHKMMTFLAVVARQLGYTFGVMALTLVWQGQRRTVRFVRDTHPGGGWRSVREDFERFFDMVQFKKNQGYSVYQVPGLGQYAFEFEKSWEYFPHGGTVEIPVMTQRQHSPDLGGSGGIFESGQSSGPSCSADVIEWRRPSIAKKTFRANVGVLKKKKPRMKTGGPGQLKRRESSKLKSTKEDEPAKKKKQKKQTVEEEGRSAEKIPGGSMALKIKDEPTEA